MRSDGPWLPAAPLAPVLSFVGLRGKDEVCVQVPFLENFGPNAIAVQQFRIRCFGEQTAVDYATPPAWPQMAQPTMRTCGSLGCLPEAST